MPSHVPNRSRAKAIVADEPHRRNNLAPRRRPKHPVETIDWLALWALSLGASAVVLAGLAFFGGRDAAGASVILVGAAAIMALALRITEVPDDSN